mmetsp:Transcript_20219/g.44990  ORF Transcript_20219/g.44990 Transcript_20219/m.44990 type:complete len:269 (+) Transcript_20219:456-1262(+)
MYWCFSALATAEECERRKPTKAGRSNEERSALASSVFASKVAHTRMLVARVARKVSPLASTQERSTALFGTGKSKQTAQNNYQQSQRMKTIKITTNAASALLVIVAVLIMSAESFIVAARGGSPSGSGPGAGAGVGLSVALSGDGGGDELTKACADDTSTCKEDGSVFIPQLPAGDPNDKTVPVLKLGESISFEELGPVIINTDGTTRRIDNWNQMTQQEREVTWKRISKRNAQRRAILEEKMREEKSDEHPSEVVEAETDKNLEANQ